MLTPHSGEMVAESGLEALGENSMSVDAAFSIPDEDFVAFKGDVLYPELTALHEP
jgi:hypothetical protein